MSVIGFYEIIEDAGLSNLLIPVKYEAPTFINSKRVCDEILNAVRDQKRIFVIGDYDVDGMMCDLIFRDGLQLLGAQNVTFYKYRKRTHSLDPVAVQQCIQNQSDYCVIADCGSNNLGLLKKLNTYGIKVILLDHHETAVTYDEFFENGVIAINTTLEPNVYKLSAGALCYCVMSEILRRVNIPEKNLAVFAVISLYADCMDMHDDLNRAIYYRAKQIPKEELPHDVTMFMNEYQVLSARFINFWFAPRINAMFRAERFDVLNKLFIDPVDTVEMAHCLNLVEELYVHVRDMVTKVADIIEVTELENMVISNLYSVNEHVSVKENKLWNYTGLVANKLSDRYSKAAVVLCDTEFEIKGSLRDVYGRDFLAPLSHLCKAGGHKPAFGIQLSSFDLEDFLTQLERLDKKLVFSELSNEPIVIKYPYNEPDAGLIEDIATINEFAGPGVPLILIRKQRVGNMPERKTDWAYQYSWGAFTIQSQVAISFGSWMSLRPTLACKTKLIVQ